MTTLTAAGPLRLQTLHQRMPSRRRVVLVHPDEMAALRLHDDDVVDLVVDGTDLRAEGFRAVSFPTQPGVVATYFAPFPRAEGAAVRLALH